MTQKRKKSKKWISWLILLLLLLAASVVAYLVWDSYLRDKPVDDGGQEKQIEKIEKKGTEEDGVEIVEKQRIEQYDGNDPNGAEMLSGVVTYAGVNGDRLMIRVNIDQYLDGGECELSLKKDGVVVYSEMANVVGNVSTATCEGFDVPVEGFRNGFVDISIGVRSGNKVGTIESGVDL